MAISRDSEFNVKREWKSFNLIQSKHHLHNKPSPPHLKSTMLRTAILKAARSAASQLARKPSAIGRPVAISYTSPSSRFSPAAFHISRCYSAAASLSKPEVEGRIVDLLKNFDKVGCLYWCAEALLTLSFAGHRSIEGIMDSCKFY